MHVLDRRTFHRVPGIPAISAHGRVLDFRRMQFQLAEAEYQRATAGLVAIHSQQAALIKGKSETHQEYTEFPQITGQQLASLTRWEHWTETESDRLMKLERAAQQELKKRRDILLGAQQKMRLLEKLQRNRQAHWQSAFEREIEELAADSVSSRYARELNQQ